jgi:hypothetical protein
MRGIAFLVLLALAGCATGDAPSPPSSASAMTGWQEAGGGPPTQTEFAALVAACEDRLGNRGSDGRLDLCLADLGLRRSP